MTRQRKKSLVGWTYIGNLEDDTYSSHTLNVYSHQPVFLNGKVDTSYIKVKITIEQVGTK